MITARTRSARVARSGGETTNSVGASSRRDRRRRSAAVGRRRPSHGPCDGFSNLFLPFVVWYAFTVSRVHCCRFFSFFRAGSCVSTAPRDVRLFLSHAFQRRRTDGAFFFYFFYIYSICPAGLWPNFKKNTRFTSEKCNNKSRRRKTSKGRRTVRPFVFVCVGACVRTRVSLSIRRSRLRKMEKNGHYLSGSFDGLSDVGHYFKSSFAKSMALETTKSLNFGLDLTAGHDHHHHNRYNTIGPHRQVRTNEQFYTKTLDVL